MRINKQTIFLMVLVVFSVLGTSCNGAVSPSETTMTSNTSYSSTSETTEALKKLDYKIDYHKVPPLYEKVYTADEIEAAHKIIDAFLSGETETSIPEMRRTEIESTESLLRIMCPPFMAMVKVSVPKDYTVYTSTISWTYRRSMDEVRAELNRFETEVSGYLDELYENDSMEMRALLIYMRLSELTEYDYTLAQDDSGGLSEEEVAYRNTAYWTIVGHTGVCYSYSEALCFLYGQAGIDSYDVGNFEGGHDWTMALIDGKYYYVDSTWSGSSNGYYDIRYFGMTTEDRATWAGGFLEENNELFFVPVSNLCEVTDMKYSDLHNDNFSSVTIRNIDHKNRTIEFELPDGSTYVFGG